VAARSLIALPLATVRVGDGYSQQLLPFRPAEELRWPAIQGQSARVYQPCGHARI